MPAVTFHEYAQHLMEAVNQVVATGEAILLTLQIDQRSITQGFITGTLQFENDTTLHFREFLNLQHELPKLMYVYHYQDANESLIFRYDNAVHRPALPQSGHKHTSSGVKGSAPPTLTDVLDEILRHEQI